MNIICTTGLWLTNTSWLEWDRNYVRNSLIPVRLVKYKTNSKPSNRSYVLYTLVTFPAFCLQSFLPQVPPPFCYKKSHPLLPTCVCKGCIFLVWSIASPAGSICWADEGPASFNITNWATYTQPNIYETRANVRPYGDFFNTHVRTYIGCL